MDYKIIVDSCGELTEEMKKSGVFETASLMIQLDDYQIIDDETFDQADFLKKVSESPNCPKSSCPSPEKYMNCYREGDAERIYAVTLSAELSGSYNSAVLGKNLYEEEYGKKKIHVFNSCSASIGETLIAEKIWECEKSGMDFETVIQTVDAYIEEQHTYFVLETLDTLRKNGRLTGIKAVVATALNIKPYMGSTPQGTIQQLGQARGMKKAVAKMLDKMLEELKDPEEKIMMISHCNCVERALAFKAEVEERVRLKDIVVLDTRGISSMYAGDGGIIVVV